MSFTDDDMKIELEFMDTRVGQLIMIPEWKLRNIFHRLEASEICMEEAYYNVKQPHESLKRMYKSWEEKAGK